MTVAWHAHCWGFPARTARSDPRMALEVAPKPETSSWGLCAQTVSLRYYREQPKKLRQEKLDCWSSAEQFRAAPRTKRHFHSSSSRTTNDERPMTAVAALLFVLAIREGERDQRLLLDLVRFRGTGRRARARRTLHRHHRAFTRDVAQTRQHVEQRSHVGRLFLHPHDI